MPRKKRYRRVRTGCITCKVRRIKCDEKKPLCWRCTSTGRRCDGYEDLGDSAASAPRTRKVTYGDAAGRTSARSLAYPPSPGRGTPSESRLFQLFRIVAAPMIAGYFDHDFWMRVVAQASSSEPAVRHAAIAISVALGEPLDSDARSQSLSLQQCNKAIRAALSVQDKGVILLTCILFICTEFIQRQVRRALAHFDQGLRILESVSEPTPLISALAPFFCRLCVVPMLFGHQLRTTIPQRWIREYTCIPDRFASLESARHSISAIWVLALSCMRAAEGVRFGALPVSTLPSSWHSQFTTVCGFLQQWRSAYEGLVEDHPDADTPGLCLLRAQHLTVSIWLDVSLSPSQMSFDKHHDLFKCIIDDCAVAIDNSKLKKPSRVCGIFTFDTGVISLLYFAGSKCRFPATRLVALELLDRLAQVGLQENLWHAKAMRDLVQGFIEHEHGCSVDVLASKVLQQETVDLPPVERRIWDFSRQDLSPSPEDGDWDSGGTSNKVVVKLKDSTGWKAQQSYVHESQSRSPCHMN